MGNNVYSDNVPYGDKSHEAISSWFIGPQAENYDFFKRNVIAILENQQKARQSYYPDDGIFIGDEIQASSTFQESTEKLRKAVELVSEKLGEHSVPFFHPRYQGHMSTDLSMPSMLGYFMTMIYNPNNVSVEASPFTTVIELEVGQQLCDMFSFNIDPANADQPLAWGHITADGSIANLESIWSARNLKFYPVSIRNAMKEGGPLQFISDKFLVETCTRSQKLLVQLSTWELLNLKVTTILEIPDRLYNEFGITGAFLQDVMAKYGIQAVGKEVLEKTLGIEKPIQYLITNTRHYSWPKGAAIAGLGSDNVVGVDVDAEARLDIKKLEKCLQAHLDNEQAVYAVVAIIGSTEEGAVDPLLDILKLRARFQAKGLSFVVHADAAWGGYFATMLPRSREPSNILLPPPRLGDNRGFVPDLCLRKDTQKEMWALRYADSITVDPHKAGYIPYPAGGLCYRDGRMRYLVTWTSPYITPSGSDPTIYSIGIYGVEGSKPGASAMSTWLSNVCIGLNPEGYGALLSEVCFTCCRLSAQWAAMWTEKDDFIVIPLNYLPAEKDPDSTPEKVEQQRQYIRDNILGKSNEEIASNPYNLSLLRELGSDLNINAFAVNWRYSDGKLNKNVEEANYLNKRISDRLCVESPSTDVKKIPLFLTSTEFSHDQYSYCVSTFKDRLKLDQDYEDLFVLRNVVMSPFPTEGNFIQTLADIFRGVVEDEVKVLRKRNEAKEKHHSFIMQGTEEIFLLHRPMFHLSSHRRQLIVSADIDPESLAKYKEAKTAHPGEIFTLTTQDNEDLDNIAVDGGKEFNAVIVSLSGKTVTRGVRAKCTHVIKNRSLRSEYRDLLYPSNHMPFYLYGTPSQYHIDHILTRAPNISLSASDVELNLSADIPAEQLSRGCILYLDQVHEASMQPFLKTSDLLTDAKAPFFFRAGQTFTVSVWIDPYDANANGPGLADAEGGSPGGGTLLAEGIMTIGAPSNDGLTTGDLFVNSEMVNRDPFKRLEQGEKVDVWKKELDQLVKDMQLQ